MADNDNDEGGGKLGTCCGCGTSEGVRNVVMMAQRAPVPGTGWGCVVCNLGLDGAVAVMCDACIGKPPRFVCRGYPSSGARTPIGELSPEPFDHDESIDHG